MSRANTTLPLCASRRRLRGHARLRLGSSSRRASQTDAYWDTPWHGSLRPEVGVPHEYTVTRHLRDEEAIAIVMDRGGIVYDGDSATLRDDQARLNRLIGVSV